MHRGFVKIYRKIMEWEWYTDVPVKVLFMHALIKANHSEKQWQGHIIKEGQFISSLGNMAKETGLSTAQVRTALKKLEKTKEISKKGTNKNTIVTVCNYESYMSEEQASDKPITNKEQSNDKRIATTKNDKNNKNEKKYPKLNKFVCDIFPEGLIKEQSFVDAWVDFEKVRKSKKAAVSERAYKKLSIDLIEFSGRDLKKAIEIVEQSADGGWTSLYKLKEQK